MPEATEGPGWINRATSLQELWQRRFDWIQDAARTRAFVKRAIREGDLLVAYDAARETVEERQSADPWMQQQMALALAQLGSTARAQAILMTLVNKDPTNRETLALLARTYKDQWCTDTSNAAALNSAFEWYKRAFEIDPPDYYPGINAASLALLRGDSATASRLAGQVLDICQRKLPLSSKDELYWLRVSLAEALVILGRQTDAKKAYRSAVATPDVGLRELCSSRRQARLLSKHLYDDASVFDTCFSIPNLVAFAGHMLDSPDRHPPRFPATCERAVRLAVDKQLDAISAGIGFAS